MWSGFDRLSLTKSRPIALIRAYFHKHFTLNPSKQTLFWSLLVNLNHQVWVMFILRSCQSYWTLWGHSHNWESLSLLPLQILELHWYVRRTFVHVCAWTSYWNLRYATQILDNGIYYVYSSSSKISNPEFWTKIRFLGVSFTY